MVMRAFFVLLATTMFFLSGNAFGLNFNEGQMISAVLCVANDDTTVPNQVERLNKKLNATNGGPTLKKCKRIWDFEPVMHYRGFYGCLLVEEELATGLEE